MSVPASRIRQLRAIFSKAKKQMNRYYPVDGRGWNKYGSSNVSSFIEARPKIVRNIKDLRAQKPVYLNETYLGADNDTVRKQEPRNFISWYYGAAEDDHRKLWRRASKEDKKTIKNLLVRDTHATAWQKRVAARQMKRNIKTLLRGETE